MDTFLRDVRMGFRVLLSQPGFFLIAVLTLSVGIGGSTAISSVIDAALLRPLPHPAPDRMVEIEVDVRQRDGRVFGLTPSAEDVEDWQRHQPVFSDVGIWRTVFRPVVIDGPEPKRVRMVRVSEGLLGVYVGFDPEAVLTMEVAPIDSNNEALRQYYPALVQLVGALPAVQAAGAVDYLPLSASSTVTIATTVDGTRKPNLMLNIRKFLPGYFEAIGVSLKDGRFPTDSA